MNSIFHKSVLPVAGLMVAGGAIAALAAIAAEASPAPSKPAASVQTDRHDARKGEKVLGIDYQAQPNYYYCGPAATRIALSTQGRVLTQDEVAKKLGTTEAGTDSANDTTRVLNELTGGGYKTTEIRDAVAKPDQVDRLRADVVKAIDAKRGVVANVKGTAGDTDGNPHAYEGGHYLSVVGYKDGGDTLRIADPFDPNQEYWMTVDKVANWIAERGYSS